MDIKIQGEMDGVELAKQLLQNYSFPILFLTSNTDSLVVREAASVLPSAFLVKPFGDEELPIAIELAFSNHNSKAIQNNGPKLIDSVFVKNGKDYKRIPLEEILYIEAKGSYSNIITRTGKYLISYNLSHFQDRVDNKYFIRVHRSFIVNLKNVTSFNATNLKFDQLTIPISKQYYNNFHNAITRV
jgi:DNA-binding LytR/AlgR family response regulator